MIVGKRYFRKTGNSKLPIFVITSTILGFGFLLGGCNNSPQLNNPGIDFIAPLGKPPSDMVIWSPVDQDVLLVNASYADFNRAEVYVLNLKTGEKHILAQTERGILLGRSWSPDGKKIILAAFSDTVGFEQGGLWILNIADNSMTFLQPEENYVLWGPGPDKLTIHNTKNLIAGQGKIELTVTDMITGREEAIFTTEENQDVFGFSWSPDGKHLVFSLGGNQPESKSNIYVLDVVSGQINQLTESDDNDYPSWSPLGDQIAYRQKTYDGDVPKYSLHIVDPNGLCDIELLDSELLFPPTWSPNGDYLAFVEASGIYTLNIIEFLEGNNLDKRCQ